MRARTLTLSGGEVVTLKRPRERDLPGMARVFRAIIREGRYFGIERYRYIEKDERKWLRGARGRRAMVVAAFDSRGRVVGFVTAKRGDRRKTDHTAEVDTICLYPDYRNRGIGRELVVEAVAWARRAEVRKLWLGVYSTNRRAIHLYRSLGFRVEGAQRRHFRIRGRFVDGVNMALWLEP